MNPITCDVRSKTVIAIAIITVMGLGMILAPLFVHNYHEHWMLMTAVKAAGWFFFVIGLLSILMMRKVILQQDGIVVAFYLGKKVYYRFDEILEVTAEINKGATSIQGRINHDGRHMLTLTAVAGKQRILVTSASFTNFEPLFTALFNIYGNKFRIIDKGVRVG